MFVLVALCSFANCNMKFADVHVQLVSYGKCYYNICMEVENKSIVVVVVVAIV